MDVPTSLLALQYLRTFPVARCELLSPDTPVQVEFTQLSVVLTVTLGVPNSIEATAPLMEMVGASSDGVRKFVLSHTLNLVFVASIGEALESVAGVVVPGVVVPVVVVPVVVVPVVVVPVVEIEELVESRPPHAARMEHRPMIAILRMDSLYLVDDLSPVERLHPGSIALDTSRESFASG